MINRLAVSLGFAAFLFGLAPSADAQSTIYAPYSCVDNCVVQDVHQGLLVQWPDDISQRGRAGKPG